MRGRRVLGGLLVATAWVILTAGTAAAAYPTIVRVAGDSRYATAAQISARSFAPHPTVAYITTATNFPDALAAGPAAAKAKGPVILVRQDAIPQVVQDELHRLHPDAMIVIGGSDAVSDRVVQKLHDTNYTNGSVTRIAGVDRYDTAAQLSAATFAPGVPVAFVTTGERYADALSGSAAAGAGGGPMLLVRHDGIPAATATELARLKPAKIVLLGGPAVVDASVETALAAYSASVAREAGADRYATSAIVSAAAFPKGAATAYLATGEEFADALAGSAAAALTPGPMLLTRPACMPDPINQELTRLASTTLVVLGGTAAVSDAAAGGAGCEVLPTTG
jgi:putative cell wall-binding protein